jgi:hypothetical protein
VVEREMKERFAEVERVELLQYGDDPAVEPGRIAIRVTIDTARITESATTGAEGDLAAFHHGHREAIREWSRDVRERHPEVARIEFTDGEKSLFMMGSGAPEERRSELTPVMARLGAADLETLDTLIRTGIAANRAEGVRWALARIRERPAYEQLRERGSEIEELKRQL